MLLYDLSKVKELLSGGTLMTIPDCMALWPSLNHYVLNCLSGLSKYLIII